MILPEPKKFQYKLNINGIDTDVLPNAPDGWLDTDITYKRSNIYMGLFRSITEPVKYVLKAAKLLRTELYTKGILANVKVIINQLNLLRGSI